MSIYIFDLDGTICEPRLQYPDTERRYSQAIPRPSVINRLRELYNSGHEIIIFTARRMVTHQGDIQKIIEDVGIVTESWLRTHNVPHHKLIFGKPYGDFYVDDKAVTLEGFQCM